MHQASEARLISEAGQQSAWEYRGQNWCTLILAALGSGQKDQAVERTATHRGFAGSHPSESRSSREGDLVLQRWGLHASDEASIF